MRRSSRGLLRIADERMADAIRHISVRKGIDPAGYALVAFGGAGGQHACRVAELLGMEEVILPGDAGLLSAKGLGHAVIERFAQREVLLSLARVERRDRGMVCKARSRGRRRTRARGRRPRGDGPAAPHRRAALSGTGCGASRSNRRPVAISGPSSSRRYFELFSYRPSDREIEVVSIRVVMRSRRDGVVVRRTRRSADRRRLPSRPPRSVASSTASGARCRAIRPRSWPPVR